jgi:hypothetical protein
LLYCMSCTAPYAAHQQDCWFCAGTVHVPVTSAQDDGTIQYYSFEEWLSVLLFVPLMQQQPDIDIIIQADPNSRLISVSWAPGQADGQMSAPLTIIESNDKDCLNDSDIKDLITRIDMDAADDAPCAICLESLATVTNTNSLATVTNTNSLPTVTNTNSLPTVTNTNSLPTVTNTNSLATVTNSLVINNNTVFNYAAQLPCHHIFHSQCVVQWLKTSPVCPCCRDSLSAHKTTRQQNA